ncbi:hypothetical protein BHE74_00000335 [Ensete ventricosum]|nr:hypothetical protein BHE74_00000335 [Ensete ventricosum]
MPSVAALAAQKECSGASRATRWELLGRWLLGAYLSTHYSNSLSTARNIRVKRTAAGLSARRSTLLTCFEARCGPSRVLEASSIVIVSEVGAELGINRLKEFLLGISVSSIVSRSY